MWFEKQKQKFRLVGWYGEEYLLAANELFERVQLDSESDYNWIASATQLYETTHLPSFPRKYAEGIMLIVLNCFANLELRKTQPSSSENTAQDTVNKIYNELSSQDPTTKRVKEKYLKNFIHAVTLYDTIEVRIFLPCSETFKKLSKEWEDTTFKKYSDQEEIDFGVLYKTLMSEYENLLDNTRKNETVMAEDGKSKESIHKFLAEIIFKD